MCSIRGTWKMWREKSISIATKMNLYYALVVSVLLYGSEYWILRKEDERRLLVAEMSWLRRIIYVEVEMKKLEMNKREKSLGVKKQWYIQKIQKRIYSGLDTWNRWRRKDYEMQ